MWMTSDVYSGQWHDDTMHGKGCFYHGNGDIYYGQFSNGKATGFGIQFTVLGSRFEGEWKDNLKHGKG